MYLALFLLDVWYQSVAFDKGLCIVIMYFPPKFLIPCLFQAVFDALNAPEAIEYPSEKQNDRTVLVWALVIPLAVSIRL